MGYRMAVVGATGAVGREILKTLAERQLPVDSMVALASGRSAGQQVSFGEDQVLTVKSVDSFDFKGIDLACSRPAPPSARCMRRGRGGGLRRHRQYQPVPHGPRRAAGGCGGEPQALARFRKRRIIANPNCSTIQMVVALKPLHDLARVKRVVVSPTNRPGAGRRRWTSCGRRPRRLVNETPPSEQFTKQIAFNCIPPHRRLPGRRLDAGGDERWRRRRGRS
jgi:aspartate-semialdehyde dehydrogenase